MKKSVVFSLTAVLLLALAAGCCRKGDGCKNGSAECCKSETDSYAPAGDRIRTAWAEQVAGAIDRHGNLCPRLFGYPRMQMRRSEWQCLNGLWDYTVTQKGVQPAPGQTDGRILVPFPIESSLSGVGRTVSPDEELWYSRTFTLPRTWSGRNVMLHFGAADWQADVYVNGRLAASHTGGYTPFSADITPYLDRRGGAEQHITVRVWDPTDAGYQPCGKQVNRPRSIWYTAVTGLWQTVWLEPVNTHNHINNLVTTPDIDNALLHVTAMTASEDGIIEVTLKEDGRVVASQCGSPNTPLALQLPSVRLWSPEEPFLYDLTVTLRHGRHMLDRVESYAAMRKISRAKDEHGIWRMQLNNRNCFQYGPLDQGWWPDGLYTAPSDEALAFDIQKTKDFGFNMIRKHVKVEPDRWYWHCDRLGMLVWQDMPSGDLGNVWEPRSFGGGTDRERTAESRDNYHCEWKEVVDMLRSHPSVVVWVPFNEAWGQFETEDVVAWTKQYDPSRLVNAASGGNHRACGDILDLHNYPQPDMYLFDTARVNVLGEYGGIGWPVDGHLWWNNRNWGYIRFTSSEEVTAEYVKYAKQLEGLVRKGFAAAVYTQTTDVEGEVNGLMTYDRKIMKLDEQQVREANLAVRAQGTDSRTDIAADAQRFEAQVQGRRTHLYTLRNSNGMQVQITNFGGRIVSLIVPDKDGVMRDVVLGFDNINDYVTVSSDFGACIGRYANRIKNGRIEIDGREYLLPQNNFGHTLHGGPTGWQYRVFDAEQPDGRTLRLTLVSQDGDNGFPGKVTAGCTYTLEDGNTLRIDYFGTTDAPTVLNMTNHAYFNLSGDGTKPVTDHLLWLNARRMTPVDDTFIPTGETADIQAGTPFDFFSAPKAIGRDIAADDVQLRNGHGYDHNFLLGGADISGAADRTSLARVRAAELCCPETGICLTVETDQPGIQVYTGNFLDGTVRGKRGEVYGRRTAVCLETQRYPDTPNHPEWPSALLRPNERYRTTTIFRFGVK